MPDFAFTARINEEELYFICREIFSMKQKKYFIQVSGTPQMTGSFEMVRENRGEWKLAEPVPDWAYGLQSKISDKLRELD